MKIAELADSEKKIDVSRLQRFLTSNFHKLVDAITGYGFEVRIVGGAVRDLLLGKDPRDIDLATNAKPDELMFILRQNDIDFTAKGIAHGTVKAVFDSGVAGVEEYEITTLGYEVGIADGKLYVHSTGDWHDDAKRRDFTVNAMSLDLDGTLYDYFNGVDDLRNQRVRMLGDPDERITKAPELALRFFKALSFFPKPKFDPRMIDIIRDHRIDLKRIPDRKVGYQLINIRKGPSGEAVMDLMCRMGLKRYLDLAC